VLTPAPVAISLRVFWRDRQARVVTGRQINVARPRRQHRIRVGVVDVVSGQRSESDRSNLPIVPLEHQYHTELDPLIEASSVGNPYLNDIVALGAAQPQLPKPFVRGKQEQGLRITRGGDPAGAAIPTMPTNDSMALVRRQDRRCWIGVNL
jgi:hypothetical protein